MCYLHLDKASAKEMDSFSRRMCHVHQTRLALVIECAISKNALFAISVEECSISIKLGWLQ